MNDLFQEIKVIVKGEEIIPIWSDRVSYDDEDSYFGPSVLLDGLRASIVDAVMNVKTKEVSFGVEVIKKEEPKYAIGDVVLVKGKGKDTLKQDVVVDITYPDEARSRTSIFYGRDYPSLAKEVKDFSSNQLYKIIVREPWYHLKSGTIIGKTLFCQIYKLEQ